MYLVVSLFWGERIIYIERVQGERKKRVDFFFFLVCFRLISDCPFQDLSILKQEKFSPRFETNFEENKKKRTKRQDWDELLENETELMFGSKRRRKRSTYLRIRVSSVL